MIRNAKLEGNIFSFNCPACGAENSTDVNEYDPQYLEEIGGYENLMVTCHNCRVMIGFNIQIPIFEAAESEGYFQYASEEDRKLRAIIREIMWRRMPDLQGRDREAEEAAYIEENGIGVPEPEPPPGMEPDRGPMPPPPVPYEPPTPEPIIMPDRPPIEEEPTEPEPEPAADQEPAADDPEQPAADQEPAAEETPRLDIDREQLVEEVKEAIDSAIQTEEGENKNG